MILQSACLAAEKSFTASIALEQFNSFMDIARLSNTYDTDFIVDSIVFTAWTRNPVNTTGVVTTKAALCDAIAVRIGVGQFYLMDKFVSPALLCSDLDGNEYSNSVSVNTFQRHSRRWVPPCPLLLKPHWPIQIEVKQLAGLITPLVNTGGFTQTVNVWIEVIGRLTDAPTPEVVRLPYIMSYQPTTPVVYAATGPTDLFNKTGKVVNVQRLVGRLYDVQTVDSSNTLKMNQLYNHDVLRQMPNAMRVELVDSFGYGIMTSTQHSSQLPQQYPPMGLLFDTPRSTFNFNRDLQPDGQYLATFYKDTNAAYTSAQLLPWIAAIGSREEYIADS